MELRQDLARDEEIFATKTKETRELQARLKQAEQQLAACESEREDEIRAAAACQQEMILLRDQAAAAAVAAPVAAVPTSEARGGKGAGGLRAPSHVSERVRLPCVRVFACARAWPRARTHARTHAHDIIGPHNWQKQTL